MKYLILGLMAMSLFISKAPIGDNRLSSCETKGVPDKENGMINKRWEGTLWMPS